MTTEQFTSWPLGQLPRNFQRPELDKLRAMGYGIRDPRDAVTIFEAKVAEFAGAKYAVAVDCCSHGLFLGLKYLKASGVVSIPKHTYISVPNQILHAGCKVSWRDEEWSGVYQLKPYPLWDAAVRWRQGMYEGGIQVVSFQIKKRVPIGRGGMVLTDDKAAADWIRCASYDGRDLSVSQWDDDPDIPGWHYYMTPEDAARGIILMSQVPQNNPDSANWKNYADLSTKKLFRGQQ